MHKVVALKEACAENDEHCEALLTMMLRNEPVIECNLETVKRACAMA